MYDALSVCVGVSGKVIWDSFANPQWMCQFCIFLFWATVLYQDIAVTDLTTKKGSKGHSQPAVS
jgi:hypothetical protein